MIQSPRVTFPEQRIIRFGLNLFFISRKATKGTSVIRFVRFSFKKHHDCSLTLQSSLWSSKVGCVSEPSFHTNPLCVMGEIIEIFIIIWTKLHVSLTIKQSASPPTHGGAVQSIMLIIHCILYNTFHDTTGS